MSSVTIGTLFLSLLSPLVAASNFKVEGFKPKAFQVPSPNVVTSNVLSLTRHAGSQTRSTRALQALQYESGVSNLTSEGMGQEFLTSITIGTNSAQVVLDTGSSDTWLAETGFQCVTIATGAPRPEKACKFGPLFTPSSTFKQIPDVNFNITYGDLEFLTGIFGTDSVTLAQIKVPKQHVALVNLAAWDGDGVSSGLVGMAYPSLTDEFNGTNPHVDSSSNLILYDPVVTTMIKDKLIDPLFSLAIDRGDGFGGYLAIGGLPPVKYANTFATTPIQILKLAAYNLTTVYSFYTITADGYTYSNTSSASIDYEVGQYGHVVDTEDPKKFQAIVDSGTTLVYLPNALANAINAEFDPPAKWSNDQGAFVVDCNAKAPNFGVVIGNETLQVNPKDMILKSGKICITGVSRGNPGPYILGDVFLKSVVAVFDIGASEMRFAAREFYTV
ncbi:MAG: hypothetical protein MMC33_001332 [Icmadophila ericetorum]|nr:hypothetical protein [Icmadophila ericetorum]